ncbi:Rrf2 family transcriptional regulator [Cyanobium sp. ATX 6E8]|uniref:RrF2 family transcriptional regulator n=1 Tax=Cyanobium sp. ATX 6E8 TaxID=2823701 RepID=UPI0020CB9E42|nr:Rrf2 family transcriptional regulator [Cyanobium sp. ATX 6E8]MCP9942840.1 Rrf2 family transcriptional regulator [Cyanobium sp. ATX 6E8]
MGFSAKTDYGLVALMELAAAYPSGTLVQSGEICRRHGIPERYLEQLLTDLRKVGLLTSIRGPRGGFQLARDPDCITVADVVNVLEGSRNSERQGDLGDATFLVLTALEQKLEQARETLLASTSLAQLLRERDALRQPQPMFYI